MYVLAFKAGRIIHLGLGSCCRSSYLYKTNINVLSRNVGGNARKLYQKNTNDQAFSYVHSLHKKENKIGPMGWFLLLIPLSTFLLGTWQVKRRKWKLMLIDDLHRRTTSDPIDLPEDLEDIKGMEYRPVKVRGKFLHDKELFMGPRSLIENETPSPQSTTTSFFAAGQAGWLVITPFQLSDRNVTILVNRGWIPSKYKLAKTRTMGQIEGELELTGIVRAHEERAPFVPNNRPTTNSWFYRNLNEMCQATGCDPIFLDAKASSTVPGGPIGGQTCVSLRNEHLSYIFTWYSLSSITGYLWHRLYIARKPLL